MRIELDLDELIFQLRRQRHYAGTNMPVSILAYDANDRSIEIAGAIDVIYVSERGTDAANLRIVCRCDRVPVESLTFINGASNE